MLSGQLYGLRTRRVRVLRHREQTIYQFNQRLEYEQTRDLVAFRLSSHHLPYRLFALSRHHDLYAEYLLVTASADTRACDPPHCLAHRPPQTARPAARRIWRFRRDWYRPRCAASAPPSDGSRLIRTGAPCGPLRFNWAKRSRSSTCRVSDATGASGRPDMREEAIDLFAKRVGLPRQFGRGAEHFGCCGAGRGDARGHA